MLRILFRTERADAARPAIFVDRDGVINQRRANDYVLSWNQFEFLPGIRQSLKRLAKFGLPMIVISNQAAVGKGLLDTTSLTAITERMQSALLEDGIQIASAYYCTHRPDENCVCRKPLPGLLHRAADDNNIDLGLSIFIGDSETDVQAARAAGCRPILLRSDLSHASLKEDWVEETLVAFTPVQLFEIAAQGLTNLSAFPLLSRPRFSGQELTRSANGCRT
jgi:D-glycero-D-manno-heptose 1,7-bisphosphate phosphatase